MFVLISMGVVLFLRKRTQQTGCHTYNLALVKKLQRQHEATCGDPKDIIQVKYVGHKYTNRCRILLLFASK